jgi:hydroxymethylpyrimidine pyrophosphatase-like HAD family hydrolase
MAKVVFASDIDKTLTDERHIIPDEVVIYLEGLYKKGFEIVLLTGRTFSFAMMSVEKISFPFYLAVQNGAEVLKMPEKEIIFQTFMQKPVLAQLDRIYHQYEEDFLIYSGLEMGDFCYYRRSRFSPFYLEYLEKLKKISAADWVEIESILDIKQTKFPLIKCLGPHFSLEKIRGRLLDDRSVASSLITDTVDPNLSILLLTHSQVDKGNVLKKIKKKYKWNCKIIAAGDDNNDITLLQGADIGIAMKTGSKDLQLHADIIANSSYELGIISALEEAEKRL